MKIKWFFILLLMAFISGCARDERDFNLLCDYFNELDLHLEKQELAPEVRWAFIQERVINNLPETSNARTAWIAISSASPEFRYELFVEAAKSVGLPNWQCPALQKWVDTF
jgi:hypothetical protein